MAIHFDDADLVPAIAPQFATGEVPMMVWLNRDAATANAGTGKARCWARSRGNPVVIAETEAGPKDLRD